MCPCAKDSEVSATKMTRTRTIDRIMISFGEENKPPPLRFLKHRRSSVHLTSTGEAFTFVGNSAYASGTDLPSRAANREQDLAMYVLFDVGRGLASCRGSTR